MWGQFDFKSVVTAPPQELEDYLDEFKTSFKAGIGMFCEAYFLFAIGNLHPIWKMLYPSCFEEASCSQAVQAGSYVEVGSLILGMLVIGLFADKLGRLWCVFWAIIMPSTLTE